jgi:hypothetical protein
VGAYQNGGLSNPQVVVQKLGYEDLLSHCLWSR